MGPSAGVGVRTSLADLVLAIDFFQDSFKADVLSHGRPLFLFGRLSGAPTTEHPLARLLYLEDLLIELALCRAERLRDGIVKPVIELCKGVA